MSEPRVIGIPVGGAVAEGGTRHGAATGAVGTRRKPAERSAAGAASLREGCRCGIDGGADQAAGSRDRPAKFPTGDQPSKPSPATRNLLSDPVIEYPAACPPSPGPMRTAAQAPDVSGGAHQPSAGNAWPTRFAGGDSHLASASEAPLPAPGGAAKPAQPAPIFHLIAESGREAPALTLPTGAHLEVGVRGRPRVGGEEPPSEVPAARGDVRQPGRVLAFAAVAAMVVGSGFLVRGLTLADPVPPPLPPAWASRAVGGGGHRALPMGYARPTRVSIARVGIHADVLAVGLAGDGAVGVPPAGKPLTAAWYDRGPAPGQAGPAVITGHVDSRFAPGNRAAFYELGAVRPGDDVDVARADRRVAVFRVDSVALVPKAGFPTRDVYGPTGYAALRLITCGGHYDRRTGYADNVIVYAHLVGSR